MTYDQKILILTPVKDAVTWLDTYFSNLRKLSYPSDLISIGIIEGDSKDSTWSVLKSYKQSMREQFRSYKLFKKDYHPQYSDSIPRWSGQIQIERRSIIAKCRNHLLFRALDDEDWVLWLDCDVIEYPPDIIQMLLQQQKKILHPNCVQEYGGKSFDLNAWKDGGKKFLHDLKEEGDLVEIHSVGGTLLFINADLHRDGLIFPPFLYGKKNPRIRPHNKFGRRKDLLNPQKAIKAWKQKEWQGEIETDGLGMMAHDMGEKLWGMPNLEIKHRV